MSLDLLTANEGSTGDWTTASQHAMPVLFVVFQSGRSANGGVESITQIIERLQRVERIVVTQRETPINQRWRDAGAAVHVYPGAESRGWIQKLRAVGQLNQAVYRLVRLSSAPVVHCNDIGALWCAGPGARAAGASIVFNVRDVKPPQERYGWNWRLAQIADRILVLSSEMCAELRLRLPGAVPGRHALTRIEHIYSMVDLDRMRPVPPHERATLRQRLGIRQGEFSIAYVAAVAEKKSQLEFLEEAGPLLKSRLPEARVHFVGDFHPDRSEYARRCLDTVARLQIEDRVVFEGYSAEVAEWYGACDVTVLASRREGLARCMIESIACGTPVVSFDVCSAAEVLEAHGCGRVVPQADFDSLVEQLVLLQDAELRGRMGRSGRNIAERLFDPASVVDAYEGLYFELRGISRGTRCS